MDGGRELGTGRMNKKEKVSWGNWEDIGEETEGDASDGEGGGR